MKKFYNIFKEIKKAFSSKEDIIDAIDDDNIDDIDNVTLPKSKQKFVTSEDLFKDDKDNDVKIQKECKECSFFKKYQKSCNMSPHPSMLCRFLPSIDYDKSKKTIIILDDNEGVVSFLLDDIKEILKNHGIEDIHQEFNLLTFSSQYCAFNLMSAIQAYNIQNIDYGIFDITLGGGVFEDNKGNIVLDGVDAFQICYEISNDMKYVFFTGNKLNPYIKKNKEVIEKFSTITGGKDLHDYVLYKTSKTLEDRRQYLYRYHLKDILNKGNDYDYENGN